MIRRLFARLADPHRHCRAQQAATLTHVGERDQLRSWMRGVDAAYTELDVRLRQRAQSYREDARHLDAKSRPNAWQIAVAHELEQVALELNPSAGGAVGDLSARPDVAGVPIAGAVAGVEGLSSLAGVRDAASRARAAGGSALSIGEEGMTT